jgi:hypothetical protein
MDFMDFMQNLGLKESLFGPTLGPNQGPEYVHWRPDFKILLHQSFPEAMGMRTAVLVCMVHEVQESVLRKIGIPFFLEDSSKQISQPISVLKLRYPPIPSPTSVS